MGSDQVYEIKSRGWRRSKDLGILDFNRFVKNWISTDKFFFQQLQNGIEQMRHILDLDR